MKRVFALLMATATLAGIVLTVGMTQAQTNPANPPAGATSSSSRGRIAVVNLAKVLKEFEKANVEAKRMQELRQAYLSRVTEKKNQIAEQQRALAQAAKPPLRDQYEKQITDLQREIQDISRQGDKELSRISDDTIVAVYKDIYTVIDRIAVANNIELVLCYQDYIDPKDAFSPVVARMKLQSQAAMPFYHRNMDITDAVVSTLNKYFKPSGVTPTTGTTQPTQPNNKP